MWRAITKTDVVFLHTIPYPHNYIAFCWAKILRKKTVIVPHFHPTHPHYERRSNYWLMKQCNAIMTVSEYEKRYLEKQGIPADKISVTGNGIHPELYEPQDLDMFRSKLKTGYGLNHSDKVIVFIGRKTREKGVLTLIEASKAIRKEMPVKLFLIGPSIDWYDSLYAGLSAQEKKYIIDMGVLPHNEKVNLLHLSDLLVLPSQYEAFGIVFLEAWICGKPVIGTTEGAMPSVIGNDGHVSTFGDAEDLKSKIVEALSKPEDLKMKGISGRNKVLQNYTWDIIGMKAEQAISAVYEG
jgi:glycosyltransferase involved in cell wall biosynthesis